MMIMGVAAKRATAAARGTNIPRAGVPAAAVAVPATEATATITMMGLHVGRSTGKPALLSSACLVPMLSPFPISPYQAKSGNGELLPQTW
jgi:hypothetical protein